jgi:hypothetical protein
MEGRFLSRLPATLVGLMALACSRDTISTPEEAGGPQAAAESVTAEGSLFPIATSVYKDETSASLAFDGTNLLVGYLNAPSGSLPGIVKARMVSPVGALGAVVSSDRPSDAPPFVAFDGTNYLLVWRDLTNAASPNLRGLFVSTGGVKVGSIVKITQSDDVAALDGLAFGGGTYLVTYNRNDGKMYRKVVSTAGVAGTARALASLPGQSDEFSNLATDGTDFLAVWRGGADGQAIKARLVHGDGSLGAQITVDNSAATTSDIVTAAFAGGNYLVVWTNTSIPTVYGRLVTAAGTASGGRITLAGPPAQSNGVVITSGGGFALEYVVLALGNIRKIKLQFIDAAGTLLGTPTTLYSRTPNSNSLLGPLMANGSDFVLILNRLGQLGQTDADVFGQAKTLTP